MLNIASLYDLEEVSCEKVFKMQTNNLLTVTLTALETGNLTPLVKEELKYTIQSRRLAKGQKELEVDFPEQVNYELTQDEREKIRRRREQNRQAAHRFRSKRKASSEYLCNQIQTLETDNKVKRKEINKLLEEKAKLQRMLQEHLLVCHREYKP